MPTRKIPKIFSIRYGKNSKLPSKTKILDAQKQTNLATPCFNSFNVLAFSRLISLKSQCGLTSFHTTGSTLLE
jgi:hypothetical protein